MPEDQLAPPSPDPTTEQRRDWSTPRLERLDVHDTEQGVSAKQSSSLENSTSYNSPPVC
jgi:hypothetical protein